MFQLACPLAFVLQFACIFGPKVTRTGGTGEHPPNLSITLHLVNRSQELKPFWPSLFTILSSVHGAQLCLGSASSFYVRIQAIIAQMAGNVNFLKAD